MDEIKNSSDNASSNANCQDNICDNMDVTSCSAISAASTSTNTANIITASATASSSGQNLHADLWNKFLKTISQQHETERKYPDPNVPEFYPRNWTTTSTTTSCFNARSSSGSDQTNETSASTTKCTTYSTNNAARKQQDLVLMSQQCLAATAEPSDVNVKNTMVAASRDAVHGVTRYYWTFGDPRPDRIPHPITYKSNRLEINTTPPRGDHFCSELSKKDMQLLHLNNVVKALLEEIWRLNELLMKHRNTEQLKTDISFAIDKMLKPSSELGFHCDDCCDKFKQFVVKIFKQQERKTAKQQAHYKDVFIDYLVSIIENSVEAFNKCDHVKYRFGTTLAKHDVATQTEQLGHDDQRKPYKRPDSRRSKHQMTKIYRNRNFHKVYDLRDNNAGAALDASNWYAAPAPASIASFAGHRSQREKNRSRLSKQQQQFQPCAYSYSTQHAYKTSASVTVQQPSFGDSQLINPIQLVHQKYKNLNCRLEGIPDKNLVKFSYIVNDEEYSAIAPTKKEAQYQCAWHVLGATTKQR